MQTFLEIRFPDNISYGAAGGPEFLTDIVTTSNGKEQRNINWKYPRCKYNISHAVKIHEQLHDLIAFFRNCKGKAIGFRFKDWSDYKATNQLVSISQELENNFQLIKVYKTQDYQQIKRIITKPVVGTVKTYINGFEEASIVDYKTGQFSFLQVPEPDSIITADFEFDVPVRFDTDKISASIENYGHYSCNEISLIEIKI
jgi:uncharacterized protein (TIGR02217 family)